MLRRRANSRARRGGGLFGAKSPRSHTSRLVFETLEERTVLNAAIPGVTLDPALIAKFVNELPNRTRSQFRLLAYRDGERDAGKWDDGKRATVPGRIYEISQNLGLGTYAALGITPPSGKLSTDPVMTTVYGYGTSAATATFPGRSFVVNEDSPIAVNWVDGLTQSTHLLPVDPTVLDTTSPQAPNSYTVTPATVANTPQTGTTQAEFVTFTHGIPIIPHVHGGHTQAASDGTPMQWFTTDPTVSGMDYVSQPFVYDNTQQAGTIWYHDHAMGITRLNVYAGLAGFYIIHDTNELGLIANHTLPAEKYDIPLAIQDRMFDTSGQLYYPADVLKGTTATYPSDHPEFFGDTILVNGQTWPVLDVEPRMYRFRILNGSNSRFYDLEVDPAQGSAQQFFQVGTDDALMANPVPLQHLLIGPGERAEIVIDFSKLAGQTIILTNSAKGPLPKGTPVDPHTTGQIMAFRVSLPLDTSIPDATLTATSTLNTITPLTAGANPTQFGLFETEDSFDRLIQYLGTTDGWVSFVNSNDTVQLGADGTATVTWQIYNNTADVHPIHLHQVSFQLIQRQDFKAAVDPDTGAMTGITLKGKPTPPAPNEVGWKDTVQMYPGTVTTIVATFDLPGKYVWHCHILEHEEHDMMHFIDVIPYTPPTVPVTAMAALLGAVGEFGGTPVAAASSGTAPAASPANPVHDNQGALASVLAKASAPVALLDQSKQQLTAYAFASLFASREGSGQNQDSLDQWFAEFEQNPVEIRWLTTA